MAFLLLSEPYPGYYYDLGRFEPDVFLVGKPQVEVELCRSSFDYAAR